MKKLHPLLSLPFLLLLSCASCTRDDAPPPSIADTYTSTTVVQWNTAATTAVARATGFPPMTESRVYAMVALAVHDALNHIQKKYNTYALSTAVDATAHPDAAVAQSAHDVLAALIPLQKPFADSLLTVTLAAVPDGPSKDAGITLGKASAAAMLAKRSADGAATAQYFQAQGTVPGAYRSTPPFEATGLILLPGWGKVTPFALSSPAQFRPASPYPVNSAEYTTDFNEVKTQGAATGSTRTADQTQIGIFWLENVPLSWNRIAVSLAAQKGLTGWQTARLLALVHIAEADANIAVFDAKYFYNYWRPITAVRLADTDGNAATTGDAAWNVLAPPTPPVPDYPSNHAADGGAAAEVLKRYFGRDDLVFSTTSNSLPGVSRSFTSLSGAANEVSLSRIYVGYHYRYAVLKGEEMGRKIGAWVWENSLRER